MAAKPVISVVSPVYRSRENLMEFVKCVTEVLDATQQSFEIILVDDRSPDDSWSLITEIFHSNRNVKAIRLSKNFGQHYAVTAGLTKASGDWIFIMDCDLQDDPVYLQTLLDKAQNEKLDIVFTKRTEREQPVTKKIAAWIYNAMFGVMSDNRYGTVYGSLVLFNDKVKRSFLSLKDRDRLYIQMLRWLGFNHASVEVQHKKRFAGKSSYTFGKAMKVALQGWVSFSNRLLYFSVYVGFAMALLAFLSTLFIVFQYVRHGYQTGWPSLFVAIIFSTGLVLISIGVAGIYIGKVFDQAKDRPLFIVDEELNNDEVA